GAVPVPVRRAGLRPAHARREKKPGHAGPRGRAAAFYATDIQLLPGHAGVSGHDPGRSLDGFPDAAGPGRAVAGVFPVAVGAVPAVAAARPEPARGRAAAPRGRGGVGPARPGGDPSWL